jgi:hypothetical protein
MEKYERITKQLIKIELCIQRINSAPISDTTKHQYISKLEKRARKIANKLSYKELQEALRSLNSPYPDKLTVRYRI